MKEQTPVPPPSLTQAEGIVRRLLPVITAHQAWVRRILSTLVCRTRPDPEDLRADGARRCAVGRWLSSEPSAYIRRHPARPAVVEHHREMHRLAARLCNAVLHDEVISPEQFQAFSEALDRFNDSFNALLKELWETLNFTDPLTGMFTRVAMRHWLHQEQQRARRTGQPCSLCLFDLDHFKDVNDALGHRVGDVVLQTVSARLLNNLRPSDQVYRYGGEEFLLMLPATSLEEAVPVVERLRELIAKSAIAIDEETRVHITVSAGIAALDPAAPVRDSIDKADQAMYAAKRAGRNRVRVWRGDPGAGPSRPRGSEQR